jgi:hypothetical protein
VVEENGEESTAAADAAAETAKEGEAERQWPPRKRLSLGVTLQVEVEAPVLGVTAQKAAGTSFAPNDLRDLTHRSDLRGADRYGQRSLTHDLRGSDLLQCQRCQKEFPRTDFSSTQCRKGKLRRCRSCVEGQTRGEPREEAAALASASLVIQIHKETKESEIGISLSTAADGRVQITGIYAGYAITASTRLQVGDIILKVNGTPVITLASAFGMLRQVEAGAVALHIERECSGASHAIHKEEGEESEESEEGDEEEESDEGEEGEDEEATNTEEGVLRHPVRIAMCCAVRSFARVDQPHAFECPICLDKSTDVENWKLERCWMKPQCGHILCSNCALGLAADMKTECPECRASLLPATQVGAEVQVHFPAQSEDGVGKKGIEFVTPPQNPEMQIWRLLARRLDGLRGTVVDASDQLRRVSLSNALLEPEGSTRLVLTEPSQVSTGK